MALIINSFGKPNLRGDDEGHVGPCCATIYAAALNKVGVGLIIRASQTF